MRFKISALDDRGQGLGGRLLRGPWEVKWAGSQPRREPPSKPKMLPCPPTSHIPHRGQMQGVPALGDTRTGTRSGVTRGDLLETRAPPPTPTECALSKAGAGRRVCLRAGSHSPSGGGLGETASSLFLLMQSAGGRPSPPRGASPPSARHVWSCRPAAPPPRPASLRSARLHLSADGTMKVTA